MSGSRFEEMQKRSGRGGMIQRMREPRRLLEFILVGVIAVAAVGLLLEDELPVGAALGGIALMLAWWRLRLPPP